LTRAAGRSVYLGDVTSPIRQRSLQGKVTYEGEPSEIGQNASNLSRAKSDQWSASEAAFVVTCPEIPSARTKGEACPVAPFSSQSTTFPDKNGSARSQRTVAAGGCCWRSRAMPFQSAPDGGRRVWGGSTEARRPPLILTPKPDVDVHVATFIRQDGVRRQFVFNGP
jgi:hypothetical protein